MDTQHKHFNFGLRSEIKKKAVDILSLWLFQFMAVISAFISQLILAKELSVGDFGALSTSLTLTLIVSTFVTFGIGQSLVKIFGEEGEEGFETIKYVMVILLLLIFLILPIYSWLINYINLSSKSRILLNLFIVLILAQSLQPIVEGIYQLEGNYRILSLTRFLVQFSRLFVVLILCFLKFTLLYVAFGYVLTSFILLIIYLRKITRLINKKIDLKGFNKNNDLLTKEKGKGLKKAFKITLPFALTNLFFLLYTQGNIFFVGLLLDEENAGIFSIAFTIMNVIYLFPVTFYQSYLIPQIYRWSKKEKRLFINLFEIGGQSAFTVGIIIMLLVSSVAVFIVPWLFGEKYLNSSYVLIIMSISIPFRLLANNLGSILISGKAVNSKAIYQGIGVILNITLNYVFIPKYGVNGAALSVVITEFFVAILFIIGVKKHVEILKEHMIRKKYIYGIIYILSSSLVSVLLFFKSLNINIIWYNLLLIMLAMVLTVLLFFHSIKASNTKYR